MEIYCELQNKLWKDKQSATGEEKRKQDRIFYKHVKDLNVRQIVCGFYTIIRGSNKVYTAPLILKYT